MQRIGDIIAHAAAEQQRPLKDGGHFTAQRQRHGIARVKGPAPVFDAPLRGRFEEVEQAQQGALSRAARPDEGDNLAGDNIQLVNGQHPPALIAVADVPEAIEWLRH